MHEVSGHFLARTGNQRAGAGYNVVVDSREAALAEAGELIAANVGADGVVELGELVAEDGEGVRVEQERVDGIREAGDITVFKSVGVGVQDVAIAAFVTQRAQELGLGTRVTGFHR